MSRFCNIAKVFIGFGLVGVVVSWAMGERIRIDEIKIAEFCGMSSSKNVRVPDYAIDIYRVPLRSEILDGFGSLGLQA